MQAGGLFYGVRFFVAVPSGLTVRGTGEEKERKTMMSPEIEREMIRRHRNGTIRFDHEGEFWRDDEKRTVKMMFEEGYGISEIAFAVGRSEPAVMQQIEKMDLYQRTLNPKRHKSPPKAPTCLCDSCSLDLSACPRCEAHLSVQEVE